MACHRIVRGDALKPPMPQVYDFRETTRWRQSAWPPCKRPSAAWPRRFPLLRSDTRGGSALARKSGRKRNRRHQACGSRRSGALWPPNSRERQRSCSWARWRAAQTCCCLPLLSPSPAAAPAARACRSLLRVAHLNHRLNHRFADRFDAKSSAQVEMLELPVSLLQSLQASSPIHGALATALASLPHVRCAHASSAATQPTRRYPWRPSAASPACTG